jgi:predicted HAD superfamily phosphohydrolase YqeG
MRLNFVINPSVFFTGINQASKLMNLNPEEIVVIGDQMLTDVFGGNRRGLYAVVIYVQSCD